MRDTRRSIKAFAFIAFIAVALSSAPARAAGVVPQQATPVQREQAQSRFLRGKAQFAKKQYQLALDEFTASLDIVASPNTRLYVGRCLRELNKTVAAYVELGRTEIEAKELARDDPRYERAGQSAHQERAKLEPKLAFINVEVAHAEPDTTLRVAGDEVRRGGWSEPIPAEPGEVDVVVETKGHAPVKRTVTVAAGERKSIDIDAAEGGAIAAPAEAPSDSAKRPSGSPGPLRNVAYVTGGAAVVGLGIFAFFGLKANGTYSDLDKACSGGPCPPGHEAQISEGRTQQTVANVGLAVFVLGAAASVTLWVLTRPTSSDSTRSARAWVDLGPSFTGLRGAF